MSTVNSHKCLFFHRLAFYVWRASCLPVHLCVCVCLLVDWCDKIDTGDPPPPVWSRMHVCQGLPVFDSSYRKHWGIGGGG